MSAREADLAGMPCPSPDYGPAHQWIVLVSQHSLTAPYGCQHCDATTTGAVVWAGRRAP